MKKRWKILVAFLCAALTGSCFAVFGSAATTSSDMVYFNRSWDDGYPDVKGFSQSGGTQTVKTETDGNRYYSIKGTKENEESKGTCVNAYMQFEFDTAKYEDTKFVFEFDLYFPASNHVTTGPIIVTKDAANEYTHGGGQNSILTAITSGSTTSLYSGGNRIYTVQGDDWVHIALCVNYNTNKVTSYIGSTKIGTGSFSATGTGYLKQFRVNLQPGNALNSELCIDNLAVYAGDKPRDLYGDPGLNVDPTARIAKQYVAMKTGVPHVSLFGTRTEIADGTIGEPFMQDNTAYVPLSFLAGAFGKDIEVLSETQITLGTGKDAVTLTVGSSEGLTSPALVRNGLFYVSMEDAASLLGVYSFYDDMGLILFSKREITLTREDNLSDMVTIMNSFILDDDVDEVLLTDIVSNLGAEDVHPRIGVTQSRFDELRAVYEAEEGDPNYNAKLKSWIQTYVAKAESYRSSYFTKKGGTYELKDMIYQPYFVYEDTDGDGVLECIPGKAGTDMYGVECIGNGYDVGGRSRLSDFTQQLQHYGFAYQMTGDTTYADCFYAIAVELNEWQHWGEGHFLNCADGAVYYATGFDWLYHAFDGDADGGTARRTFIADALYRKAIFPAWGQFRNIYTYVSSVIGNNGGNWSNKTNNWVTVCSSGIMTSILSIAEYGDLVREYGGTEYKSSDIMKETVASIFEDLPDCFHAYAPDGSYVESPGYWAYGTNTLFLMVENLYSATGKDYGLMDVYGLDKTCDFALNIESSDYVYWNYHDSGSSYMQTNHFAFVGKWFGRADLIALRYQQIENGKSVTHTDILYYDEDYDGIPLSDFSLDYYSEGIDTFVTRSSWEKGAIFTGLHGGNNNVSHGNTDGGNFIIYKGTEQWICDLGSDNYNVRSYYNNPSYYRSSTEGANTVVLTSLKYGQERNASAKTVKTYGDEYGSYSVMDTSALYGSYVSSAYRGMLFTADRSSIIVQDEIYFTEATEFYWFAHTKVPASMISISEDGRTAYLRSGNETLRATIVSDDTSLTFTIMDTYHPVLDGTFTSEEAAKYSDAQATTKGQRENDRSSYYKLAVHGRNKVMLNMAVVFEFVEFDSEPVCYEWSRMENWTTYADTYDKTAGITDGLNGMIEALNQTTNPSSILNQISRLKSYLNNEAYADYVTADILNRAEKAISEARERFTVYKEQKIIEREDALSADDYKDMKELMSSDFSYSLIAYNLFTTIHEPGVKGELVADEDGNQYYKMSSDGKSSVTNSYFYYHLTLPEQLCIEFDYTAETQYPAFYLNLRYNTSVFHDALNLYIDGSDVYFKDKNGVKVYVGGNMLSVGEWTHFALAYHFDTLTVDLYINDILVASDVSFGDEKYSNTVDIRFNFDSGVNPGEMCFDNIKITSASAPLNMERHLSRICQEIFEGQMTYKQLCSKVEFAQSVFTYGKSVIDDADLLSYVDRLEELKEGLDAFDEFVNLSDLSEEEDLSFADKLGYLNDMYVLRPDISELPTEAASYLKKYNDAMKEANETLGYTGALYSFAMGEGRTLGTVTLYIAVDDAPVSVKRTKSGVSLLDKEKIVTLNGKDYYAVTMELSDISAGRTIDFYVDFKVGKRSQTKLIALSLDEYAKTVFTGESYSKEEKKATYDYLSLAAELLKEKDADSSVFDAILAEYSEAYGSTLSTGMVADLPKSKENLL